MDGEIAKYQHNAVYYDIEQQAKKISIRIRENVASLADEMGNTDLSDKIKNAIPQSYENYKDVLNYCYK